MGLFDLLSPVFGAIDGVIDFLPAWLRLTLWALLASALTMWVYRLFSNQEELAELKPQIKSAQAELAKFDGEMSGLWPLIGRSTKLSLRQLRLSLTPALWASIPVIFLLVWVAGHFGYYHPEPGTEVDVTIYEAQTELQWRPPAMQEEDRTYVLWPAQGSNVALYAVGGSEPITTLPFSHPIYVIHKKQWWNWLLANPAGYIADDAPVEAIYLDLPWQKIQPFGPSWMQGWEFLFFTVLVAGSLAIKFIFRIH
ncbi:MAG: hypothetical protein DHS20C11_19950 [Lysobacteraceae bacterium]|nr:MAG: hypothetical protein DHS20C11_19950 [Xanthomonadaceae bacterium]